MAAFLTKALEPADFEFNPKTPEDVRALQVEIMHKELNRELSREDYACMSDGTKVLRDIICPRPQFTVVQAQAQISKEGFTFQGVKISGAADFDALVTQGGVAYETATLAQRETGKELP
jgi:hypothetical protein